MPLGVPVRMTSFSRRVMNSVMYSMSSATERIMLSVLPFWRSSPLTSVRICSACGSGTASFSTRNGPKGRKVSKFLGLMGGRKWLMTKSRTTRSLATV